LGLKGLRPFWLEAGMAPPPNAGAAQTPPRAAEPCRALLRGLEAAGLAEAAAGQKNRSSGCWAALLVGEERSSSAARPECQKGRQLAALLVGARTQLAAKSPSCGAQSQLLARLPDLPAVLLAALDGIGFEERKAAAGLVEDVLTAGLRHGVSARQQVCCYLRGQPQVADLLLCGCRSGELAFLCGQLLSACAGDAAVAELLLEGGAPMRLVSTARAPCCFEVASTALAALQELLLGGAEASAAYLLENFREFFLVYHDLLQCSDYATKRQALSVLSRVLLSPGFGGVMARYGSSARSLKLQMTLLLHPTTMVKVGAFHIFKIFVANPHQAPAVQEILFKNREGLARLLRSMRELCEASDKELREDLVAVAAGLLGMRRPEGRTPHARDLRQHCQPMRAGPGGAHQEWSDLFVATPASRESESLALSEAVAFVGVH